MLILSHGWPTNGRLDDQNLLRLSPSSWSPPRRFPMFGPCPSNSELSKLFFLQNRWLLFLFFFRNWDWQALVVSVFPVPAGPAGLSWWIVDCFFHMPVFAPHLHIKWLDTELEVWSHQPHQSQPCHELPDAPPKNIPRAWDLDGVFAWFLMKLMKLWHPQPETGWDSTDLSELWWPT